MSQAAKPARRSGANTRPGTKRSKPAEDDDRRRPSRSDGDSSESARDVGKRAQEEARGTAEKARSEAAAVADTASEEASNVMATGMQALEEQAGRQTRQLADRMYDVRDEMDYLLRGQPDEAGQVGDVVQQLADRLSTTADRMAEGGPRGLVDDARDLAGRRPGVFLLGAVALGFGAGRLLRSARDADDELLEQERSALEDGEASRRRRDEQ